jgi:hypothetical protein
MDKNPYRQKFLTCDPSIQASQGPARLRPRSQINKIHFLYHLKCLIDINNLLYALCLLQLSPLEPEQ